MAFDPSTASIVEDKPIASAFDPSTATPIDSAVSKKPTIPTIQQQVGLFQKESEKDVTQAGAFAASALESAGATPGALVGARAGMAFPQPFWAKPVTGVVGGFVGGYLASKGITSLESAFDKVFGTKVVETRKQQQEQFPITSVVGGVVGGGANPFMRPSIPTSLKQAAVGAGIMGTVGAAQRAVMGEKVFDPTAMAIDIGSGTFTKPTKLGEKMLGHKSVHSTTEETPLPPEQPSKVNSTPEQQKAFLDKLKETKAKKDVQAKVVQTAFKNNETGEVELHGPMHDPARKAETSDTHTQGFIDENGNFLDRKEAWNRAKDLGQVEKLSDVKMGLQSGDMRTAGDKNFELFSVPETVGGLPVSIDREMKRSDGSIVGARYKHETNEVSIHPEHTYQQFLDKAWTKPKVEGVFPIAENAFKTPQEWADFVLQHEAEHIKNPIAEGQTKAQYENQTNKAALKTIAEKKSKETGELVEPIPISETPEPIDRTKTDPRDIKSQEEFENIAQEIYEKHGEVEAVKFFEGYEKYKQTWSEPIGETEKFVGTNLKAKAADERIIYNNTSDLKTLAGKEVDLDRITYSIDKGDTLTGKAKEVATKFRTLMDELGKKALENGVIKGWHEDYVARNVVTEGAAPPTAVQEFIRDVFGYEKGVSDSKTTTKYGQERKLETRQDLVDHLQGINSWLAEKGYDYRFKLKTDNLADIYRDYALSVEKAIENKNLINNLKQIRNVNGESLIRPITDKEPLPYGWKVMENSELSGYAVHPDLMPHLKFVFDSAPGDLMKAFGAISQFTKRLNVIGSFFHAKSLMEVMSSTGIPIWTPVKEAIVLPLIEKGVKAVTGKELQLSAVSKAVEQFRKGGVGTSVDKWIREDGLQLEVPEDVSKNILSAAGKLADSTIGKFGPKTRVLEKSLSTVEKYTLGYFDKYTWDYLHTGGKLMVAEAYLDKARMSAAKENKPFDEAASRKEIARFLNDSFGGLNWYDAATQTQNEFAKRIALSAYSPAGRRSLQIALFAPDWTLSTLRAFTAALPKDLNPTKWQPVEGIKGMITPTTKSDYARLYQFKTALTYFTLLNAINMVTANRPIWENKDPTRIEYPDGTSMQAMKHAMEPYHWISDPDKTLANKLGFIPKAVIVGVGGLEYASPQAEKLVDRSAAGRLKAVAKIALPFQIAAGTDAPEGEGVKRAVLGTMGFPIYGKTPEQRKAAKAERAKALKEAAAKYHQKAKEKGWEK